MGRGLLGVTEMGRERQGCRNGEGDRDAEDGEGETGMGNSGSSGKGPGSMEGETGRVRLARGQWGGGGEQWERGDGEGETGMREILG